MPCFPGTYGNFSRCEPCPTGTYQTMTGQLNCDVCSTGKHVTEDRTQCQGKLTSVYIIILRLCYIFTVLEVTCKWRDVSMCVPDSVCVSAFLSRTVPGTDLTCISESQVCTSTCADGYIQDNGGSSTTYNCSGTNLPPVVNTCQSKTHTPTKC